MCVCVCVCIGEGGGGATIVGSCANASTYDQSEKIKCAQARGTAKIMVTVVATQDLQAGSELLRFEAEAAHDKPRPGSTGNDRYVVRS